MKNIVHDIISGKNFLTGLIALIVIASIALGCNCGKDLDLSNIGKNTNTSSPPTKTGDNDVLPPDAIVEDLVLETMKKFRDGVQSEDFSELYNDASTDFQGTYTLTQVNSSFKSYVDKKKFVVPILDKAQSMSAEFDRKPSLRTEKGLSILMASGKFKTKPYNVRFDYEYVKREGEWKLLKLVINIP